MLSKLFLKKYLYFIILSSYSLSFCMKRSRTVEKLVASALVELSQSNNNAEKNESEKPVKRRKVINRNKCNICNCIFGCPIDVKKHQEEKHMRNGLYCCPNCEYCSKWSYNIRNHLNGKRSCPGLLKD